MRSPRQSFAMLVAAALAGATAGPVAAARAAEPPSLVAAPPASATDERDILDVLGVQRGPRQEPEVGKLMRFLLPVFSVNPTSGVSIGVGLSPPIALGPPERTIVWGFSASVL